MSVMGRIAAGALLCAAWLLSPAYSAETFDGKVVSVVDGDSIGVLREGREVKIRLHAVDAPESAQAFGTVAKQFTSKKVFGTTVTVQEKTKDRYGRTVAVVTTAEGDNLSLSLIRNGYGWWYHQYGAEEHELAAAEIEARAARRGLWKDANPSPPWAFRHPTPASVPPAVRVRPTAAPRTVRAPVAAPAPRVATVYITRTGAKYHAAGCQHLRRSMIPISAKDAQAQGYGACSVCSP